MEKVKVMLSLCLTEYHSTMTSESGGIAPHIISTLNGDDWSASRSGPLTPVEIAPGTQ